MERRPPLVYRRRYNFGFPGLEKLHPFDIRKFAHAMAHLKRRGVLKHYRVESPPWPADDLLLRVHTPRYLRSVRSPAELARIVEVPLVAKLPPFAARYALLHPMRWAVGGTLLAAELALAQQAAVNLGGGFHHARSDFGHGFCVYSDVAVAVADLRVCDLARRFLIVDLDAHQGDGHSTIFRDDAEVQILDMYNVSAFPADRVARESVTWNIPLAPLCRDGKYLSLLEEALPKALDDAEPDLVFYLAGTDVVAGDPVGMLGLSPAGVLERDLFVWRQCRQRGVPVVMLTAGGYTHQSAQLIATTVEHLLTEVD